MTELCNIVEYPWSFIIEIDVHVVHLSFSPWSYLANWYHLEGQVCHGFLLGGCIHVCNSKKHDGLLSGVRISSLPQSN